MASVKRIATAFFHAGGMAPNAWNATDDKKFNSYYTCMTLFFWSARRAIPEAKLELFTNRELPLKAKDMLKASGATITIIPNVAYVSDPFFSNKFPGCLFILDVIDYLAGQDQDPADVFMFLDSDCIFLRRPQQILDLFNGDNRLAALQLYYPLNHMINGQTIASLSLASKQLYGDATPVPVTFYGGEFYAFSGSLVKPLATRVRMIWTWLKRDEQRWFERQVTEEHILTLALNDPAFPVEKANASIKRVWTASNYSNVDNRGTELDIWHLPAEKKRGFPRLTRKIGHLSEVCDGGEGAFLQLVQREMNLSPPRYLRLLRRTGLRLLSFAKALLVHT